MIRAAVSDEEFPHADIGINMKIKINKEKIIFVFFFYFFLLRDVLEQSFALFGYVDELIALLAIPLFFLRLRDRKALFSKDSYTQYIFLLVLLGVLGNAFFQYQPIAAVLSDLLLVLKFWLAIYVGRNIAGIFSIERNADFIYLHVKFVSILFAILMIFAYITGGYGIVVAEKLFYSHQTVLVGCCAFLACVLLSIRNKVKHSEIFLLIIILLMCSTARTKAFGTAIVVLAIYLFSYIYKKRIKLSTILWVIPILLVVGWSKIEFYFFGDDMSDFARYQLLIASVKIATDHFPFGAGFGTFASYASGKYYSPLYVLYGISEVHGLQIGSPSFISDSFWPMILGEFGWFGIVMYLAAMWFLVKEINGMYQRNRAFYVSALSIMAYLLIASLAEAAFVHPLAIPLAIWLGIMFENSKTESGDLLCRKRS